MIPNVVLAGYHFANDLAQGLLQLLRELDRISHSPRRFLVASLQCVIYADS